MKTVILSLVFVVCCLSDKTFAQNYGIIYENYQTIQNVEVIETTWVPVTTRRVQPVVTPVLVPVATPVPVVQQNVLWVWPNYYVVPTVPVDPVYNRPRCFRY